MSQYGDKCYIALVFDEEWEYEEHIESSTQRIETDPTDYVALHNRGVARYEMGQLDEALQDIRAAIALAPNDVVPHLCLVRVLDALGDLPAAVAAATNAVHLAPADCSGYLRRAEIYRKLGMTQLAEEDEAVGKKLRFLK